MKLKIDFWIHLYSYDLSNEGTVSRFESRIGSAEMESVFEFFLILIVHLVDIEDEFEIQFVSRYFIRRIPQWVERKTMSCSRTYREIKYIIKKNNPRLDQIHSLITSYMIIKKYQPILLPREINVMLPDPRFIA